MSKKTSPLDQIIAEIQSKVESVNTLRQRATEIDGQIAEIGAAPVNLEDFFPKLRAWIDAKGRAFSGALGPEGLLRHDSLHRLLDAPVARSSLSTLDALAINERTHLLGSMSITVRPDLCSTFDAFCFFLPDLVEEKLTQEIRAACGANWGNEQVPAQTRRLQMADLSLELCAIKKQMEVIEAEISEVEGALRNTTGAQAQ